MSGAAAGAFVGLMIGNNITRLVAGIAAARQSWPALAERGLVLRDEEVGPVASASGKQRPYLAGAVDGCEVEVHIHSDMVHYATTVITARPPRGADVVVGVHPSPGGVLGYLRSWIGQDIQIGDQGFDDAFLITGKPESAAGALLDLPLREKLLSLEGGRFGGFTYTRERVSVALHGVETGAAALGRAIDAAVAGARFTG